MSRVFRRFRVGNWFAFLGCLAGCAGRVHTNLVVTNNATRVAQISGVAERAKVKRGQWATLPYPDDDERSRWVFVSEDGLWTYAFPPTHLASGAWLGNRYVYVEVEPSGAVYLLDAQPPIGKPIKTSANGLPAPALLPGR